MAFGRDLLGQSLKAVLRGVREGVFCELRLYRVLGVHQYGRMQYVHRIGGRGVGGGCRRHQH